MAVDTTVRVVMPPMGDSVTEGTVLEWRHQEGDTVEAEEPLVEISTDKVDAEVPSPASGTLVKILVPAGETVAVGAPLAELATNGAGAAAAEPDVAGSPTKPTLVDIITPGAGESVTEGTILQWSAAVGEGVSEGDTIVEISTDKVDVELAAPASGTLAEILASDGETVTVGQVIGRISADHAGGATAKVTAPSAPAAAPQGNGGGASAPVTNGLQAPVSPVAARAAAAERVDLARVAGSGRAGRITKRDVLDALRVAPSAATEAEVPAGASELRGGAAMLARYMDESLQTPTATSFRTITVTTLEGRRSELKAAGKRVSFTHLIAYAIARAAVALPTMSHHFARIGPKPYRVDDGAVNLGLAVDVERKDGSRTLMVPVIRDAGTLSFADFLAAYDSIVEKTRTNTLTADDLVGANITLTNPGGIGTIASVPRLMSGQGTIVATGSIAYPPGLAGIGPAIGAEKVMTMTSTYDHRVIQGAESGRFLAEIERYLQGEDAFYEDVFAALGVAIGPAPARPAPAAAQPPAAPERAAGAPAAEEDLERLMSNVQAATALLRAHRTHGHLAARLDPLGTEAEGDPSLDPESLGLTPEAMRQIPARVLRTWVPGETLADALPHLRDIYCGTVAYEIEHVSAHRQRRWLREKIESAEFRGPLDDDHKRQLLRRLIQVDALERFLHKAYLGQKQFSIEGLDMTVPMLDELIALSGGAGAREVVIGMAHRGRLNVLAHNLGRPYETIFAEFEGTSTLEVITTIPQGGTGDVKYHHGEQGTYELPSGGSVLVNLESNPSHLEFVSPLVVGACRAAQSSYDGSELRRDTNAAVPVSIHGDAAFPGQGVVAETLNLQGLDGYTVGGTVHLIMNNQVGFTTDPGDSRSTHWASDLAKGFDVPIIHVNADDVPACVGAIRLAFAYRQEFGKDVLIDLIGYRRFGHNEADEPAYTQPEMYAAIKGKRRVSELWAEQLVADRVVRQEDVERQQQEIWDSLTEIHQRLKRKIADAAEHGGLDRGTGGYELDRSPSPDVSTAVPAERLRNLGEQLLRVPDDFTVHPKLVRQLDRRREALGGEGAVEWAHAEALAFASLIGDGTPIRLTGQDTERGTFSQRHLVLHDARTGRGYSPIQQLPDAKAPLELHNSPLSETGCLGFEYGYSQESPDTLVLWEAQFGDFVNGAQVIVDQFISSGLAKWGQTSRLTLLLPHGYEGSGPEHSSARLERFLQLAAEGNLRVANPTTAAQYFHLLRRQALVAKQRPLIVMTPKSLLRMPQASSSIDELASGEFRPVIAEPGVAPGEITRLVLCSGKIYYDIVGHPSRPTSSAVAVARVELLYPFPERELLKLVALYPQLREVVWVQEEPRNMGARAHMTPRLLQILPEQLSVGYIGRPERASPGEGYPAAHDEEQNRIVRTALDLDLAVSPYPEESPGNR